MTAESQGAGIVELEFDSACHSADAIQRAAYVFSDRFSMTLGQTPTGWRCSLKFRNGADVDETIQAFETEVLDYVLRERIREETAGVRNAVLALAFSQTHLADEPA